MRGKASVSAEAYFQGRSVIGRVFVGERENADGHGPNVDGERVRPSQNHLRRDPIGRSDHFRAEAALPEIDRQPKVDELDVALHRHHDVGRLQVAVCDEVVVQIVDAVQHLAANVRNMILAERRLRVGINRFVQRAARQQFHDDPDLVVVGAFVAAQITD